MSANKDKYPSGGFDSSGSAGAISAFKDKYTNSSFDTTDDFSIANNACAASVNEDEDVGHGFNRAVVDGVDEKAIKQLKLSKFKILVAIINCKKFHLPKKTVVTKLS